MAARGGSKGGGSEISAPPTVAPTCENFLLKLRSNVDYVLKIRPIMFCDILMIYITYKLINLLVFNVYVFVI